MSKYDKWLHFEVPLWADGEPASRRLARGAGRMVLLVPREVLPEDAGDIAEWLGLALRAIRKAAKQNCDRLQAREAVGAQLSSARCAEERDER